MLPEAKEPSSRSEVFEATLHEEHPADLLARLNGELIALSEYTITPGAELGSTHVSLVLPSHLARKRLPWYRPSETLLHATRGVEAVRDIEHTARHHMSVLLNGHHAESHLLVDVIMRLGGHVKKDKDGITLRITGGMSVIDQLYAFMRGMPGLAEKVSIRPVFESVAARESVDDLVPCEKRGNTGAHGEECTLRITGDTRGAPDIAVLRHLAEERRKVSIDYLSRREMLPGSTQFEMIAVLHANDPKVLQSLPAALVSSHAGIDGAKPVAADRTLQYLQVVVDDGYDARDLMRAHSGLQVRHKRMDRRPVVTGSVSLTRAPRIQQALLDAKVPHAVNVPIAVDAPMLRPTSREDGRYDELREDYRRGMRQLLVDLLQQGER